MSAVELVLKTPASRWNIALHPLDPARAEHAVRPYHEHQDHQHVRREILSAAADIGVEIAGCEVLYHAHDQAADHRAADGIQSAQDNHGKHLQPDERELHVDTQHRAPHHAAECRDDAGHRPGECEV